MTKLSKLRLSST